MADMSSESIFSRSARSLVYQAGELVHVFAVYLGIAVLVTLVLSVTVPALREQSQQMHDALLVSLRPAGLQDDLFAFGRPDSSSGLLKPPDSADAQADGFAVHTPNVVPNQLAPAAGAKSTAAASSAKTFTQALTAWDTLAVPGVTKTQLQALRSYIARKYKIANNVAGVLIQTVFAVGKEKKLDPQLLLAVIAIESRYNPFAESHVGAQGLMQVMTKVHREKFDPFEGGESAALNPIANIRVGSQILQDCIKRRGSVPAGLACYVGATGPSDGGYGEKVLAERRRIALASGIPVGRD